MSIQIIRERETTETTTYDRCFWWRNEDGCGFSFPCDEIGTPLAPKNNEQAANMLACLDGTHDVRDAGVRTWHNAYTSPRVGRCHCGAEVYLDRFTNTCDDCGADYNSAGQELAPREQWGEETGEIASDILVGGL